VIVPRATPDAVVERLSALLTEALAVPSVRTRYAEMGLETPPSDPATFARWWATEKAIWQPLIRDLGIALDG
jgi:tripartite-type tricarboxylate transporter receptor subunit TctC